MNNQNNFELYQENKMRVMRAVAKQFISTTNAISIGNTIFKGLEIGVNTGDCSTKIWLEEIPDNSEFWLADMWKPFNSDIDKAYATHYQNTDFSVDRAFLSTYLEVHKMESKRPSLDVHILRGSSKKTLAAFNENIFDFIYIDGDHKYETVLSDVVFSKKLINKRYGLICGDDLDCIITPERYLKSKQHPNQDLIQEGNFSYHPGVLAAVNEIFPMANIYNSFWWVYCLNGEFKASW
jgi:hypothetical protein